MTLEMPTSIHLESVSSSSQAVIATMGTQCLSGLIKLSYFQYSIICLAASIPSRFGIFKSVNTILKRTSQQVFSIFALNSVTSCKPSSPSMHLILNFCIKFTFKGIKLNGLSSTINAVALQVQPYLFSLSESMPYSLSLSLSYKQFDEFLAVSSDSFWVYN